MNIRGCAAFLLLPVAGLAVAQSPGIIEEIIVTGSYVPRTQENGPLPVDVIDRAQLEAEGNPSFVELVRNLSYTGGNFGETNQFQAAFAFGVQSINLRSLGSYRTLMLLNGRRHAAFQGCGCGDLAVLPQWALKRIEILKDGAAAIYGSDAMAGVVNLITRDGFRGLELNVAHQLIEDGGDSELGIVFGTGNDRWDWVTSAEYRHRDRVRVRDRDWALPAFAENPEGGFAIIGHPARYLPAFNGTPLGPGGPDPQCELLGGVATGFDCRFRYVFFDNLIEDEDNVKVFSELNGELGNGTSVHLEALYGWLRWPEIATSPSYPPRSLFGPDRFVPPTHPGLIDLKAQNPDLFGPLFGIPAAAQGAVVFNRAEGVTGLMGAPGELGARTQSLRFAGAIAGTLRLRSPRSVDYDVAVSWSRYVQDRSAFDTHVERMAFALDGLGGSGCNPATGTPGQGGCRYYNPFSNAIERSAVNGAINPQYNPAVANPAELLDWLRGEWESEQANSLFVAEATFNGTLGWRLPGGPVGWAGGVQYRRESFRFEVDDLVNLAVNPCPFTDPTSIALGHTDTLDCGEPTGLFGFSSGSYESDFVRSVYAAFVELSLPVRDSLMVQLAVRAEDFEGDLGSTVDPKLAFRWQPLPWLAVRGSASSTFRAPFLDQLEGRQTSLVFVPAALQWKALVTFGNAELEPEKALATNLGVLFEGRNLQASIDFWRFDIEDAVGPEPAGLILGAYNDLGCFDGGPGVGSAACDGLRVHVFPVGALPAAVEHVEVSWANLLDTEVSGVDLMVRYGQKLGPGRLTLGTEATYLHTFAATSDLTERNGVSLVSKGNERVGHLNDDVFIPALPRIRGHVEAGYGFGNHQLQYRMRYVHGYRDSLAPIPALAEVDRHVTHDLHYHWRVRANTRLSLSVINLLDEDPPRTATDMSYDPFTHNPAGRMVKLGVTAVLGGGPGAGSGGQ